MIITAHAVDRYVERVEPCSRAEARDRLSHAISISQPATKQHLKGKISKGDRKRVLNAKAVYRYCHVESLMLACGICDGNYRLLTVFRV